jgi:hypothetical protein
MMRASARNLHTPPRAAVGLGGSQGNVQTEGAANMNTYAREIRTMLENWGLIRRSEASWMGGFLVGTGLGVVAGAAVAALLTPTDGKEMRKLVQANAKRLAGTAEKKIAALKSAHANGTREQLHA